MHCGLLLTRHRLRYAQERPENLAEVCEALRYCFDQSIRSGFQSL
jgi:hypothetical protein